MKNLANKALFTVKPYIPGKPIEEVRRELGLKKVIKLASNENPYGPSPKVKKALMQAIPELNRYPDGDCFYLRQALAKRLKVNPAQLIFGNGSDEIIVLAIRAFIQPGDEVVIARPSFLIYDIAARIAGAEVKEVSLKNSHYDLPGMAHAVTERTKIIFLGNPDNPAGTYLKQSDLKAFIEKLRKDILIFIDEAYFEFVRAKDYGNSIDLVKKYKNVVVTRTFSKLYGLAGLRIGYGVAQEEIIDILNRLREPFNVNTMAQVAALACLNDNAYYKKVANQIEKGRNFLYKGLQGLKLNYVESCTNFILVNVGDEAPLIAKRLLQKGVIVRDMGFWGLKNFIRVTIGTPEENSFFLTTLEAVL